MRPTSAEGEHGHRRVHLSEVELGFAENQEVFSRTAVNVSEEVEELVQHSASLDEGVVHEGVVLHHEHRRVHLRRDLEKMYVHAECSSGTRPSLWRSGPHFYFF